MIKKDVTNNFEDFDLDDIDLDDIDLDGLDSKDIEDIDLEDVVGNKKFSKIDEYITSPVYGDNKKIKYHVGLDLGTSNLVVYLAGVGVIFNEPSIIAFDRETGLVVGAGRDAGLMRGKTHEKVIVVSPLENGVVSDMPAAIALLQYVFNKVRGQISDLSFARVLICSPSEITDMEKEVMIELANSMNVGDVLIQEEIKSGALGIGLNIFDTKGALLIDIGGGTTDVGVVSFGDIVLSKSIKIAGNHIDNEITKFIKQHHRVELGKQEIEKVKHELGTLLDEDLENFVIPKPFASELGLLDEEDDSWKYSNKYFHRAKINYKGDNTEIEVESMEFAGKDIVSGIPKWCLITKEQVRTVLRPIFQDIVTLIKSVLKATPAELAADIQENGILVIGGGALLNGLKEFLEKEIGLKVSIPENPLTCVAEGTRYLLKNKGNYIVNPLNI